MPRPKKPFVISKRNDTETYFIIINTTSGLSQRICKEWFRKSFQNFPPELYGYANPKSDVAAEAGAIALIAYLKQNGRVISEDITVGAWLEKFTAIETSPRTGINASKNRPYSAGSFGNYCGYFKSHIKSDPLAKLKMAEVEEDDILAFNTRMSVKKLKDGRVMGGTRTYKGVLGFVRMAFNNYRRKNKGWVNPFIDIDKPIYKSKSWDALSEEEMLRLFNPGVLRTTMELAVCSVMFLSGFRRSEISALKPEDLDWNAQKITVRRAWQRIGNKNRVLGPPKSKRERIVPFVPFLQDAIKKLWAENGEHEFVFCWKDGSRLGPQWIGKNFGKWLDRAKIEVGSRGIVPHSCRHSLASMLEARGVPIRYIQEILGHSDSNSNFGSFGINRTTMIYLHTPDKMIQDVGKIITEFLDGEKMQNLKVG